MWHTAVFTLSLLKLKKVVEWHPQLSVAVFRAHEGLGILRNCMLASMNPEASTSVTQDRSEKDGLRTAVRRMDSGSHAVRRMDSGPQ